MRRQFRILLVAILCALMLIACQKSTWLLAQPSADVAAERTSPPATATLPASATPVPTSTTAPPVASPTSPPLPALWVDPWLPEPFQQVLLPEGLSVASTPDEADLRLVVGDQAVVSTWIFALVAPFSTIPDSLTAEELRLAWQGQPAPTFAGAPLLVAETSLQILSAWWGDPAPGAVKMLPKEELITYAWENQPAWAIVPFEELQPRWKVMAVDGISPLQKEFSPQDYALAIPISLIGQTIPPDLREALLSAMPAANRDPARLTTVVLTGVTALVRGTALTMEQRGITYPAEEIRDTLRQADILHISNEIPFYDQCPFPELYPAELRFCSDPRYIALLEEIGTDVIELSGDHFGDYGVQAMEQTLKLYKEIGLPYYGGGSNLTEGHQPLLLEHHGNRLAFLGCNAKGISFYAPAGVNQPGAAACDFDLLQDEIRKLKAQGYLVIVTFQDEEYYTYTAQPKLVADFHAAAQAGADIVSGSQAHQPHGMEFVEQTFVHYGLGNLFFDQFRFFPGPELDHAFIDCHIFYAGKYLGTELLTIHFVDLARSRLMTPAERADFLQTIFTASGWGN